MSHMLTKQMLSLMLATLLLGNSISIRADSEFDVEYRSEEATRSNELVLCKLCAEKIKSKDIHTKDLTAKDICAKNIKSEEICVHELKANKSNARDLAAESLCARDANIRNLCANRAAVKSLCANQQNVDCLSASSVNVHNRICLNGDICMPFKAYVALEEDTTYTLGTGIPFDLIVDDPNNDITLNNPTFYTAPKTGYYSVAVNITETGLTGPFVFTGIPISQVDITVNGVTRIKARNSYLSFSKSQESDASGIILLNAGDIVYTTYRVLILDPVLGEMSYPGFVTLKDGNPFETYFVIHFLSSDCPANACAPCESFVDCPSCNFDQPCRPCDPCDVSCKPHHKPRPCDVECDSHHDDHHREN